MTNQHAQNDAQLCIILRGRQGAAGSMALPHSSPAHLLYVDGMCEADCGWCDGLKLVCCLSWCAAGMNESLLLQLGKLPRLVPAGDDTDRDAGSEATDVDDLGDAMDVS